MENSPPPSLSLKLAVELFNKSIYDKVKCKEYINKKMLLGFIDKGLGKPFENPDHPYSNEVEMYKKYYTIYNEELDCFFTSYMLSKHKWGRISIKKYLSLSIFKRNTRHSFAKDNYIDIDMKNAHPVIQYYMLKNSGNDNYPMLKRYALEYKTLREEIKAFYKCDKDIAKSLIFRVAFGGSYNGWLAENNFTEKIDWVVALETEYKHIGTLLHTINPHIIKDVKKIDATKYADINAEKRGIVGLWSQSIERLLQETAIKWLCDNKSFKLEEIIPSQDGFMILKQLNYEGIIEDINKICLDTHNIPIEFEYKPFDEAYDIPLYTEGKTIAEWTDFLSSKMLSYKFLECFGGNIKRYRHIIYVFFEGRWYDETLPDNRYRLTRMLSENLYNIITEEIKTDISLPLTALDMLCKKARDMTCKSSTMKDIVLHILTNAEELKEDFNNNPYVLGFNNGVFDLINNEFRPYTITDYITINTGWDYILIKEVNEEVETLIKILDSIQPEIYLRDWLLQTLASGLDGRAYQYIHLFNGSGGNGKGLLSKFMKAILGDYYYLVPNGVIKELSKANSASPDIHLLKGKRYCVFTEIEGDLSTAIIKTLTGGDPITARPLYCNPETFQLSATLILEFNKAPDFEGKPDPALARRAMFNLFPTNFTTDTAKIGKTINDITYLEGNPYYETQDFINQHKNAFFQILAGVYVRLFDKEKGGIPFNNPPEQIRNKTTEFLENQNIFHKVFNSQYRVVEDTNKKEKLKTMWDNFQTSDDYKKLKYAERRAYNRDGYYEYLRGRFKINNQDKGAYISGIEYLDDNEDDIPLAIPL